MRSLRAVALTALIGAISLLAAAPSALALGHLDGWVQQGGARINNPGILSIQNYLGTYLSTPSAMLTYPQATVTVYLAGTLTKAALWGDPSLGPVPLTNPFTADRSGYFSLWAADGCYDVTFSGPVSYTLTSRCIDTTLLTSTVRVNALATGGMGTLISPWTGWETALNALPANLHIYFPAGFYTQTAKVTMQHGWYVTGDGPFATYITSAFTGTALYFTGIGNQDSAGIRISQLRLANTNAANLGSAILTRLTAVVHIDNVEIDGFHYGYTNLGTTSWSVEHSTFNFQTKVSVWDSSGADYKPPYTNEDFSATDYSFQNDDGSILNCNFNLNGANANGGVTTAEVVLENTYAATIGGAGKFNGADNAVWVTGSVGVRISGSTFEVQQAQMINLRSTRFVSGGTGGLNGGIIVSTNVASAAVAGAHFIYADQLTDLSLLDNSFNDNGNAQSMVHSSGGTGIVSLHALGNAFGSGGLYDSTPTIGVRSNYSERPDIYLVGRLNLVSGINQPARIGTATLSGGTVTVANTSVTAKTIVILNKIGIPTASGVLSYTTNPGVGFTVAVAAGGPDSTFSWLLIEGP
jgi:hypothetical protein